MSESVSKPVSQASDEISNPEPNFEPKTKLSKEQEYLIYGVLIMVIVATSVAISLLLDWNWWQDLNQMWWEKPVRN